MVPPHTFSAKRTRTIRRLTRFLMPLALAAAACGCARTASKAGRTTAFVRAVEATEALEQGRAKPGDLVCFVGLGSGLNWGAILYRC